MSDGRIRILLVTTSMAGGAGLYAYQLARYLDPAQFDLQLAFGPGFPLDDAVAREGLPHHTIRWSRALDPARTVAGTFDILRLLRRQPVDIVHAQCSLAGAIARPAARYRNVPHVVFTVHAFASRDYQPAWRQRMYLAIERGLDRYTDHYFAPSIAIRDKIVDKGIDSGERVTVIPNGIDVPPPPTPEIRVAARAALGVGAGDAVVVTAGRFEQQKGLIYLIRAWPRVIATLPNARLILLGDGPLRSALETEATRLGVARSVRFLGWRTDVSALLPGADVFCLPSLWESFGYALLDAMAAGVPVVASAVEGIPEVIGERCGVMVPPGEPVRLAEALSALLGDRPRRATMAAAARRRVEAEFTTSRMVRRFEDAYRGLVGRA